jgi:hypothetical protein
MQLKKILILIAVVLVFLLFLLIPEPSLKDPSVEVPVKEHKSPSVTQEPSPSEDNRPVEPDLGKYKVRPIETEPFSNGMTDSGDKERLQGLADQLNGEGSSSKEEDVLSDLHLPPKVREVAEQVEDMMDAFDDATLNTVKEGLNSIPGVSADPSEAKIRVSGDRVTLKVTIPEEDLRIGRD